MKLKRILSALTLSVFVATTVACAQSTDTNRNETYEEDDTDKRSDNEYPAPILTTKLDIMVWNSVVEDLRSSNILDPYEHYSDNDMWEEFRDYGEEYNTELKDMSDYEFWEFYRTSYLDTLVFRENGSASSVRSAINRYIENSGSPVFDTTEICEFNIICTPDGCESEEFPNIANELYEQYIISGNNHAYKVFYKDSKCLAVVSIDDRTEPIVTGVDCPSLQDNGYFESWFHWNSYGVQINDSYEIVGLCPAP